jgi:glycosyltransferase involved in cell wall biosynthesis
MKIALFSVNRSTFVIRDIKILSTKHTVKLIVPSSNSFKKTFRTIIESDLILFWFASLRFLIPAMIAKLFGKKIITIAGGFDVAVVEHGSMGSWWKSRVVKKILNFSDEVLAVSASNKNEIISNCKIDQAKVTLLYHGFEDINIVDLNKKTDSILTIGYIDKLSYIRKGIDRFITLAIVMPDIQFHLIGENNLIESRIFIPKNVVLHGHLEFGTNKFKSLLESAKIYIQFSRHESFGCSVAEAMQFGCIPVVSDSYSLPEVMGDTGLIINNFNDYILIAEQIRFCMQEYNGQSAMRCINYIKKYFSYSKRENLFNKIIEEI